MSSRAGSQLPIFSPSALLSISSPLPSYDKRTPPPFRPSVTPPSVVFSLWLADIIFASANGLRIKTIATATSATVSGVTYSNNTVSGVTNFGILIDQVCSLVPSTTAFDPLIGSLAELPGDAWDTRGWRDHLGQCFHCDSRRMGPLASWAQLADGG